MSKKNKQRAADIKSRLLSNDEVSPFSSIVLKEKKEDSVKKVKPIEKKKPSEIVGGYDANASFADILFAYEHTGNPYRLPSQKKQKQIREMKTNFGDILDAWEGKKTNVKKQVEHKKSVNKVTKSFEEILSEYEGYKTPVVKKEKEKPIKKSVEVKKEVVHQKSVNKVTKDFASLLSEFDGEKLKEEKIIAACDNKKIEKALSCDNVPKQNPFFISENDEDKRDKKAVWSIYGDNKAVVREVVASKKDESVNVEIKKSKPYVPQKDFGDILGEFASSIKETKSFDEIKTELKQEEHIEVENRFFISENEEDKRDKKAVWSIYGDNKAIKREDKSNVSAEKDDECVEIKKSEPYTPTKEFGQILNEFKVNDIKRDNAKKELTFEEIMREKGDLSTFEKKYTLNELRTMQPQATLDLHGFTEKEAKDALNNFLQEAKEGKIRKVSVIHGKGLHSKDGVGILKSVVELTLKESGMVSESFAPSARNGGSGALWIILKEN